MVMHAPVAAVFLITTCNYIYTLCFISEISYQRVLSHPAMQANCPPTCDLHPLCRIRRSMRILGHMEGMLTELSPTPTSTSQVRSSWDPLLFLAEILAPGPAASAVGPSGVSGRRIEDANLTLPAPSGGDRRFPALQGRPDWSSQVGTVEQPFRPVLPENSRAPGLNHPRWESLEVLPGPRQLVSPERNPRMGSDETTTADLPDGHPGEKRRRRRKGRRGQRAPRRQENCPDRSRSPLGRSPLLVETGRRPAVSATFPNPEAMAEAAASLQVSDAPSVPGPRPSQLPGTGGRSAASATLPNLAAMAGPAASSRTPSVPRVSGHRPSDSTQLPALLITSSHGRTDISSRPKFRPPPFLDVDARGGRQAAQTPRLIRSGIVPIPPHVSLVIILLGGNDIDAGHSAEQVTRDLQSVVDAVHDITRNRGTPQIVVCNIIPRPDPRSISPGDFKNASCETNRRLSNGLHGAQVKSVHRYFVEWEGAHGSRSRPIRESFFCDGTHLTAAGQRQLTKVMRQIVESRLPHLFRPAAGN